jgi:hypothetical protein
MPPELDRQAESSLLDRGRREAYATSALILSLVSFVNLLGAEKSILALVLAAFALRGAAPPAARKRGLVAVAIAAVHLITIVLVIALLRDELGELLNLLRQLG